MTAKVNPDTGEKNPVPDNLKPHLFKYYRREQCIVGVKIFQP